VRCCPASRTAGCSIPRPSRRFAERLAVLGVRQVEAFEHPAALGALATLVQHPKATGEIIVE